MPPESQNDRLSKPDNIALLSLPPDSPWLNPMANVWAYLRQNIVSAPVWDTHGVIVQACREAKQFPTDEEGQIGSMGNSQWIGRLVLSHRQDGHDP